MSLAKDAKLGFITDPTGNRTPRLRVAVHYTTAAPRKLHPEVGPRALRLKNPHIRVISLSETIVE